MAQDKTQQQDRQQTRLQTQAQEQKRDQIRSQRQAQQSRLPGMEIDGFHGEGGKSAPKAANAWSYKSNFGLLYSSDIAEHRAGSLFHGRPVVFAHSDSSHSSGNDHGLGHHEDGSDDPGWHIRVGGTAIYSMNTGDGETLSYNLGLQVDSFPDEDLGRYVAKLGVDWKRKTDIGNIKISPYLQRTIWDNSDETDKVSFYALGVNARHHRFLSPKSMMSYSIHIKKRRYDGEDGTRRPDWRAGASYTSVLQNDQPYRISFSVLNRANPKKESNRYFGERITAATSFRASSGATIGLSAELGHRKYKAVSATAGVKRRDTFVGVGLSYQNQRAKVFSTSPVFSCQYRITNSNIAEFDKGTGYCAMLLEKRF